MAGKQDPDWYLAEWFAALNVEHPQAEMIRKLGYSRAKASQVFNGVVRYNRDTVNEISNLLQIRPHELLMAPEEAMALRRQRAAAAEIVKAEPLPDTSLVWSDKARLAPKKTG